MLKIFFRELRALRFYYLLTPLALYILLPMLNVVAVRQEPDGLMFAIPAVLADAQRIVVLSVAWWTTLILRPFLHVSGNEVLHIYLIGFRNLFVRMMMLLFWAYLHVAPVLLLYARLFPLTWGMVLTVGLQTLLMISVVYTLSVWLRNTFIPLLLCVMTVAASYVTKGENFFIILNGVFQSGTLFKYYIIMGLLTLIFLSVGYLGEKRLYGNQIRYKT